MSLWKLRRNIFENYIGVIVKSLITICVNSYINNSIDINIYEILLMKLQLVLGFTMEK